MSEDRIPNPTAKFDLYSKKEEPEEEPKQLIVNGDIVEDFGLGISRDFDDDDEAGERIQGSIDNSNSNSITSGAVIEDITSTENSREDVTVNEIFNDDEGGGGRNGGRSTMGDVMLLNIPNNDNEMQNHPNIDYPNNDNFGNFDDPNDNNNLYEDNSNFGDDGLQIVANGNDTNFFV